MKAIKTLFWLIIIGLLALLIYQNLEYFMTKTVLLFDLKIKEEWSWQLPEIPNVAFFGICFVIGLFLTGIKALSIKFRLSRKIRDLELRMADQIAQINELNTRLDVFTHDPYIKKELNRPAPEPEEVQETPPSEDTGDTGENEKNKKNEETDTPENAR